MSVVWPVEHTMLQHEVVIELALISTDEQGRTMLDQSPNRCVHRRQVPRLLQAHIRVHRPAQLRTDMRAHAVSQVAPWSLSGHLCSAVCTVPSAPANENILGLNQGLAALHLAKLRL